MQTWGQVKANSQYGREQSLQRRDGTNRHSLFLTQTSLGKWILKALRPKASQFLRNHHYFFQMSLSGL